MKIRRSAFKDVPKIMEIIDDAKALLKSMNIDQWQNGYPNKEQVENDISNKESYVILNENDTIVATTMFTTRKEPTYKKVIDGNWIQDESEPYGIIHRLAMSKDHRGKGISKFVFEQLHEQLKEKNIRSLKIDTHEDNKTMQALIKKMGYEYCGIIYTSYGAKRLAFEKVIS
ncbi:GNAT family N-acetyltransferase [Polaribacter batillariae]|uniref:GNAT family N-acetyltransferase n=1 Tax=Polaribacter batillariae TaxID=2808900 RepID=A0ABX7SVS7_9FLAO|nr:GNAT family N-acetyltransferase [Polaribacter batillariae]QTD37626.1 GNAT family N-acetyltransferase [Polaribacter batillariae]